MGVKDIGLAPIKPRTQSGNHGRAPQISVGRFHDAFLLFTV
ncbi:MAG: hypothetical protein ACYC9K_05055 [Sulfuricaulis sp.]